MSVFHMVRSCFLSLALVGGCLPLRYAAGVQGRVGTKGDVAGEARVIGGIGGLAEGGAANNGLFTSAAVGYDSTTEVQSTIGGGYERMKLGGRWGWRGAAMVGAHITGDEPAGFAANLEADVLMRRRFDTFDQAFWSLGVLVGGITTTDDRGLTFGLSLQLGAVLVPRTDARWD
jgi:hypothetical protein